MTSRAIAIAWLLVGLAPAAARAQDDPGLPSGHPPVPAEPPAPEGHPPEAPPPPDGLPEGHPTPTGGTVASGMPAQLQRILRPPAPAEARESAEVPAGAIRVLVVDEGGEPVPDQGVDVGILASGDRDRRNARTGEDGVATFEGLATGDGQHYRVNVPHLGATYSTMPFALPAGGPGYAVRVVRLPVTRSDEFVFFHVFRTVVEQRGERMHVIHQGELTNAGTETYAFPAEGVRAVMPEGALAFQFQRVITDQRIEELEGEHAYVMRGSLPPGTVRLAWAYDLPVEGGDLSLPVDIPMPFFGMQVIVEAIPDLEVSVRGMPRPERLDVNGEPCESSLSSEGCAWVVQTQRAPTDARVNQITIRITGIPGPGPVRLVAIALFVLFAFGGVLLLLTARGTGSSTDAREARRAAIRAEAAQLAEELESGEVGPEFAARRRGELSRELAGLYYADELATAREEADDERWRAAARAPGVAGYLLPASEMGLGAKVLEAVLTALSVPLLPLCVAFVALRPRAPLSLRGHGEIALTLVNGALGAVLAWLVADTLAPAHPAVAGAVIAASAFALALRTIVRRAPPAPPPRAAS